MTIEEPNLRIAIELILISYKDALKLGLYRDAVDDIAQMIEEKNWKQIKDSGWEAIEK